MSSFSTVLAPTLNTGFIVGPAPMIANIEAASLRGSNLDHRIVLAALERGLVADQERRLRRFYRQQRDVMLTALVKEMPRGVEWNRPEGGISSG